MSFRFVEHTADVCAECQAPDFAGLLTAATQALYAVTLEQVRNRADKERVVSVEGGDREELLVRWLQELLYLLDVERFVATNFQFEQTTIPVLKAVTSGYTHDVGERAAEVKAATYHNMRIREEEEGLRVSIVFDL